jgi:hypothetical protein
VQKVLSVNGKLPRRSYWSASTRNWETSQHKGQLNKFEKIRKKII